MIVYIAQRVISVASQVARNKFSFGVPEWRLILSIDAQVTATGAELSAETGMDKAAVSRGLQRLVELGLVEEVPARGRRQPVTLTDQGVEVSNELRARSREVEDRLFGVLSPTERDSLRRALDRVRAEIGGLLSIDGAEHG